MSKHSEETRAAVIAALLAGQSVSSVAREYRLPKGTVSSWKQRAAHQVDGVGEVATQKADEIGGLLTQLVQANIRALISMSEVAAEKDYLRKQEGAQLGTLFGITYDKVIRMLEAMEPSDVGDAA